MTGVVGTETLMELRVHKARYVYPGLTGTLLGEPAEGTPGPVDRASAEREVDSGGTNK
ncbi:MAG: hypothetical protein M3022_13005 [Actinomycetota bacterium]|nr:hypothetical protein [Actinomycetota bacterium]